jgi:hypothetical protein
MSEDSDVDHVMHLQGRINALEEEAVLLRHNMTDQQAIVARFNRLSGICRRIRWTEIGVPALADEQTKQALIDLSEFLFMDGVDEVEAVPEIDVLLGTLAAFRPSAKGQE